ncbi:MAG: YsnF/AvaK domain-containing protein [Pseudomonadota bacterium]
MKHPIETAQPVRAPDGSVVVPVLKEELHIGTRIVGTGKGVRVRKAVSEQPQQVDETLVHDEVEVRHVPVGRIVSLDEAPASRYEGDTLIVPVTEEILVVERCLRIREELHITKLKREERHTETVWLKSEEVSIEHFDEPNDRRHS